MNSTSTKKNSHKKEAINKAEKFFTCLHIFHLLIGRCRVAPARLESYRGGPQRAPRRHGSPAHPARFARRLPRRRVSLSLASPSSFPSPSRHSPPARPRRRLLPRAANHTRSQPASSPSRRPRARIASPPARQADLPVHYYLRISASPTLRFPNPAEHRNRRAPGAIKKGSPLPQR